MHICPGLFSVKKKYIACSVIEMIATPAVIGDVKFAGVLVKLEGLLGDQVFDCLGCQRSGNLSLFICKHKCDVELLKRGCRR